MSVARHHAEWLSLVETSGPFLSMPVLVRVFPQGLDSRDAQQAARLREAYEDWLDRGVTQPSVHHAWVWHVLYELLGYPSAWLAEGQAIPPGIQAVMANVGEVLRPDMVLQRLDADGKPILLVSVYPPEQDLEKPISGRLWKATAGTRMMELLHASDLPLGLITNGEEWTLVSAPRGETTGFASWYADLWMQEPLTLRAFHSLLHLRRLVGVAGPDTLPALFSESSKDQQEVTDQLGYQVRQAVEVLVQAFDRIDAESGRTLLREVTEKELYDSALTVMMRLVFLFSAEERGMLLLGDPLYDQNYAVSTLSALLREQADQHGEEVLERRHDAWCRLLSTFRAVHGGVEHEAMRLPPYGGTLFDPDRYRFLEGRVQHGSWRNTPATPLLINNRVVLHLLEALQMLRVKVPGGGPSDARRLSFRALDIEQIGHVYEGLLDHTARRASEPVLGLAGSKDSEPEIPLIALETIATRGNAALVAFLRDETGRSERAITRLIEQPPTFPEQELLTACGQDELLARRVKPFASLLRKDSFGQLLVIAPGSMYITSGSDRRSSGTHYTPSSLTEPIVKHTLEPLVYVGPAEGVPPSEWTLTSAKEILGLKVCDLAMGSGAFLVETCRYLAERLVEAWENAEREHPGSFVVTPDGQLSAGDPAERLVPIEPAERVAIARRYVADRCLYGIDINPMAVEMAKLSIWLITLQRDRPFTFLDHALKCGDSLIGVSSIKQIENFSLRPGVRQITFATADLSRSIEEASAKRRALEDLPSNDHSQIDTKKRLHGDAEAAVTQVKAIADILIGFELAGFSDDAYDEERNVVAAQAEAAMRGSLTTFQALAADRLGVRRTFQWPIEFPEVFDQGGFEAVVGNPPFVGGRRFIRALGEDYQSALLNLYGFKSANIDLCAYFLVRAFSLLNRKGSVGLIATKTIAEGDTREGSLVRLLAQGATIYRASPGRPWPGAASVLISTLHLTKREWKGPGILGDMAVSKISSFLSPDTVLGEPYALKRRESQVFQGSIPLGDGFMLSEEEADALAAESDRNKDVVKPFITGQTFCSDYLLRPNGRIICFQDWPLPVAERYPTAMRVVRARVFPERMADERAQKTYGKMWWQFWRPRMELYSMIKPLTRCLVNARVAKHYAFEFLSTDLIFLNTLHVFPFADYGHFCLLQSNIHTTWAAMRSSSVGVTSQYTPNDCFGTFPFPETLDCHGADPALESRGRAYHELRSRLMRENQWSLTEVYNRFHDPALKSGEIEHLRALHAEMDHAVTAAYGLDGLDLGHDFQETKQGLRLSISAAARCTVLERLLAVNHRRYAEEVSAGLHDKGARKRKNKARPALSGDSQHSDLLG